MTYMNLDTVNTDQSKYEKTRTIPPPKLSIHGKSNITITKLPQRKNTLSPNAVPTSSEQSNQLKGSALPPDNSRSSNEIKKPRSQTSESISSRPSTKMIKPRFTVPSPEEFPSIDIEEPRSEISNNISFRPAIKMPQPRFSVPSPEEFPSIDIEEPRSQILQNNSFRPSTKMIKPRFTVPSPEEFPSSNEINK